VCAFIIALQNLETYTSCSRRKQLILTPLTPLYAHMSPACEWEISIERDSGIGTARRLRRTISHAKWRRFNSTTGRRRQLTAKHKESDREAGEEDSAMKLKLTPLTPSYAHMSSACEWEISVERDSGIGTEQKIDGDDWRRLERIQGDDDSIDSKRREQHINSS
jgi:hypothetical protein